MQGQASLLDYMPSVWGLEKCTILCIQRKVPRALQLHGLKELRGPMGMGVKISLSHYWVASTLKWLKKMGVSTPLSLFAKGKYCQNFLKLFGLFQLYVTIMNIAHLGAIFVLTLPNQPRSIRSILNGIRFSLEKSVFKVLRIMK